MEIEVQVVQESEEEQFGAFCAAMGPLADWAKEQGWEIFLSVQSCVEAIGRAYRGEYVISPSGIPDMWVVLRAVKTLQGMAEQAGFMEAVQQLEVDKQLAEQGIRMVVEFFEPVG